MDSTSASDGASLAERLQRRADAMAEATSPVIIRCVIAARQVLVAQRRRGIYWAVLADLLTQEGVALTEGTLRNYIAMVGKAEAALRAAGNDAPGDDEIHAALRAKSPPIRKPRASPASVRPPAPAVQSESTTPVSAEVLRLNPAPPPRTSLVRKPDRDL